MIGVSILSYIGFLEHWTCLFFWLVPAMIAMLDLLMSSFKDNRQKRILALCLFLFPMLMTVIYFIIGTYSKENVKGGKFQKELM